MFWMTYLKSSHFSDLKTYIICIIWNYGFKFIFKSKLLNRVKVKGWLFKLILKLFDWRFELTLKNKTLFILSLNSNSKPFESCDLIHIWTDLKTFEFYFRQRSGLLSPSQILPTATDQVGPGADWAEARGCQLGEVEGLRFEEGKVWEPFYKMPTAADGGAIRDRGLSFSKRGGVMCNSARSC